MPFSEQFFGNGHSWERVVLDEGVDIVARFESLQLKAYKDMHRSGYKWAIGYGHVEGGTNHPIIIPPDMTITAEEAWQILKRDIESKARFVDKTVPVPVTSHMFTGLVSLVFNIGEGNWAGNEANDFTPSPVLLALREEKYVKAGAKFHRHNKAWVPVMDENDQPVIDPLTGKNKVELQEVNGLHLRRSIEAELFARKVMKE